MIFTKSNLADPMPTTTPYHAFYSTDIENCYGNHAQLISNPVWDADDNGVKHLPMYACSNDKYLTFYNIFAVLKITLPYNSSGIEIETTDVISGHFDVVEISEGNELKGYKAVFDKNGGNSCNRLIGFNSIKEAGEVIYVAVPAMSYIYLRIILYANGGTTYYKDLNLSKVTNRELEVNKIYTVDDDEDDWRIYYDG